MNKITVFFFVLLIISSVSLFADENESTFELSIGIVAELSNIIRPDKSYFRVGVLDAKLNLLQKNSFALFTGIELPVMLSDYSLDLLYVIEGFVNSGNIYLGVNYRFSLASNLYLKPSAAVQLYPVFCINTLFYNENQLCIGANANIAIEYQFANLNFLYFKAGAAISPDEADFDFIFPLELGFCFIF